MEARSRNNLRMKHLASRLLVAGLLALQVFFLFAVPLASAQEASQDSPTVHSHPAPGVFTYTGERAIQSLEGEWIFYWQELLSPPEIRARQSQSQSQPDLQLQPQPQPQPQLVRIPGDLTKQRNHNGDLYPSDTYGTLYARVRIPDTSLHYGLKASYIASANRIWINGELRFISGQPATNREDFIPRYMPAEIYFQSHQPEVEIVMEVSNFHHRRIRFRDVLFGPSEALQQHTYRGLMKESALAGGLLLVGIYYGILHRIQRRDKAALYLAGLAIAVAMRGLILQEKLLLRIYPEMPGELLMKLGFLPVFVFLPLISLYIGEVFQIREIEEMNAWLKRLLVFSVAFVFLTPGKIYDYAFDVSKVIFIPMAFFIIYLLVTKRNYREARGYRFMLVGSVILFITAVNDIFREFDMLYTPELFSTGIFLFVIIQAVFLAWKYDDAYVEARLLAQENESMFEEIQELNRDLEQRILSRTRDLELANQKLEAMSHADPLTGLFNRRYFEQQLEKEWNRALREGHPVSLLMIDIDAFKEYNDNYGHLKGDDCLIAVAVEIKRNTRRGGDFAARYGGEEFVVFLPETNGETALRLAEKIREGVERMRIPHATSQVSPYITISVGVNTLIPTLDIPRKYLLDQADRALYLAKNQGRNRIARLNEGGSV